MCAGCHFKAHQRPTEFTDFVKQHLGDEEYDNLRKRANETKIFANYELEELYQRFKEI
jgi:hypothetical protein